MTTALYRRVALLTAGSLGAAAAGYSLMAGLAWIRYGHPAFPAAGETDALLDQFMPSYDIVERQRIAVKAPADVTFGAACDADLTASPIVRAIFRTRELVLGAEPDDRAGKPRGLLAVTQSIGWGVLAEVPGREIVMGAVTQPWEPHTIFRAVPPDEFRAFNEPGYVKIAWTLRADAAGPDTSIFRHETRATATDPTARSRFRRYWAAFSPGISLIRWLMLAPVKHEAESRAARRGPLAQVTASERVVA
jgi:hypothetical protein